MRQNQRVEHRLYRFSEEAVQISISSPSIRPSGIAPVSWYASVDVFSLPSKGERGMTVAEGHAALLGNLVPT